MTGQTGSGLPSGATLWRWLALGAFLVTVPGPVLALLVEPVRGLLVGQTAPLVLALPLGRRGDLLLHSLALAAAVALASMVLGLLAGSLLWRWRATALGRLRWLVVVPLLIPPYVHALAWSGPMAALGAGLRDPAAPAPPLLSWLAAWWVLLMALAPLGVMLAIVGLEAVETRLVEAGRLLVDDLTTCRRVVLPLAGPAVLAGGVLVFVLCLLDYSVPSLFGLGVYALEIFAEYAASGQLARAMSLGLPLLGLALLAVTGCQGLLRQAAVARPRPAADGLPLQLPRWLVGLQWLGLLVLTLATLWPLASLIVMVGSFSTMLAALVDARSELAVTALVGLAAALLALPLTLAVADRLRRPGAARLWWALVVLPLATPGALVGLGLIALWNQPLFPHLYGTLALPILAGLARFGPVAALVLLAQLTRLDPLLIDAARLLQTDARQTLLEVLLPLLAPGLIAAFSITLILTAGELSATLLVAPPGQATLTPRIYNYLHYGASSTVAGLCLAMAGAGLLAGLAATCTLGSTHRVAS